ncbi:MBOAT family protein [Leptospira congkakensis]|uniref:MBOAT family protein n=2 Tax=Leptospira congkakensis TaxID=2484932 RepID=A0A4Z1A5G7_9LEPT|nr:MBOAT family protein [Leptospira congkakensis]TGL91246.1 MBOAT family protein [Leptospira congkakensis]TGL98299.1 MBOAT family protein [Leptospira congkakensis]
MVFSTVFFIFLFFPIIFILFSLVAQKYKMLVLLTGSVFFYFWGEQTYILIMFSSIFINFIFGLLIDYVKSKKVFLFFGIFANLLLIIYFKYATFIVSAFSNITLREFTIQEIHLPLGISFFTFQGISYLIDIYRRDIYPDRNFLRFSFYISFFPQLIAGPIVRYSEVMHSLSRLKSDYQDKIDGMSIFVIGLGKKVVIANTLGIYADEILNSESYEFGSGVAWLAIISYSFQIYFDFSGYSDMAIGLGRIFGLTFPVNFNFPYRALSFQEFWRRWHISLSSWFRDYLYIPFGGNRKSPVRQYLNLLIVFICCGFWHGASWNFLIWGMYHGFFLVLERTYYRNIINYLPNILKLVFTFALINIGWVFFRLESTVSAVDFIEIMFGKNGFRFDQIYSIFDLRWIIGLGFAIFFSYDWRLFSKVNSIPALKMAIMFSVFSVSIVCLLANNYNPFIYFRF